MGNTVRTLQAGAQSDHARREDCRLRTPRQRIVAHTLAESDVIWFQRPRCPCSGPVASRIARGSASELDRIRALLNLRAPRPTRDRIERAGARPFGRRGAAVLRRTV